MWAAELYRCTYYPQEGVSSRILARMKYGWPTGFMGHSTPQLNLKNHTSSLQQPLAKFFKYLQKEISLGIMGQFTGPPFDWVRTNPLMARPKKE